MNQTVIIQEQLLQELKQSIEKNNRTSHIKLKLDVAVFYVSLLNSIPSFYREDEQEEKGVSLHSKKMESYNSEYKKYFDFLTEQGFIIKISNYGADIGECNYYDISNEYNNNEVISYVITDKVLLKGIERTNSKNPEKGLDKRKYCEQKRPHLIKFFDDKLKIDEERAIEILKPLLENGEKRKYISGMCLVNEFKYGNWQYSIQPDTDNRLHSSMTRLNKVLRPCITYDGEKLGLVDIKSSQPFFFCVILKAILSKDRGLLKQIGATRILNKKHIDGLFNLDVDTDEVNRFISLIINGDFYDYFGQKLNIKYDDKGKPYRKVSNFSSKKKKWNREPTRIILFDSVRDLAKNAVMEIFFSKPRTPIPEAKSFRQTFPNVFKVMSYIKCSGLKFDCLLTNVEAYCFLDCAAKEFSKKHPNVPLFSIHDSLVTTQQYLPLLKEEIEQSLINRTLLKVTLIKQ